MLDWISTLAQIDPMEATRASATNRYGGRAGAKIGMAISAPISNAAKAAAAAKEKNDAKQQLEDRLSAIDTQLLVLADRLQTLEKAQAQQEASAAVRGVRVLLSVDAACIGRFIV